MSARPDFLQQDQFSQFQCLSKEDIVVFSSLKIDQFCQFPVLSLQCKFEKKKQGMILKVNQLIN